MYWARGPFQTPFGTPLEAHLAVLDKKINLNQFLTINHVLGPRALPDPLGTSLEAHLAVLEQKINLNQLFNTMFLERQTQGFRQNPWVCLSRKMVS